MEDGGEFGTANVRPPPLSNDGDSDSDNGNDEKRKSDIYPEWSWDHVRTYVAIRRGDKYSDTQIRALAAQDVVMLEKMNGHEAYGSVERGTLATARRIKAVNSKVKILFYLNCMLHYGGYDANKDFLEDEWALRNPRSNNEIYKWRGKVVSYDHTNADFREWWVQRGINMLTHKEIDGVFIDAICKTHHAVLLRMKGKAWVQQHEVAYLETAKRLRERLPPGKLLIGNVIRAGNGADGNYRNLQYLDGSYLENWSDVNHLPTSIQLMSKALKEGKMIMLNADMSHIDFGGISSSLDDRYSYLNQPQFIDFPLGCFLLVVQPHAYFSYHVGVDGREWSQIQIQQGRRALTVFDNTRFDAITRKLGEPLGDYVDDGDGGLSREFEHLYVHVNVKTRQGMLTVKEDVGISDEL